MQRSDGARDLDDARQVDPRHPGGTQTEMRPMRRPVGQTHAGRPDDLANRQDRLVGRGVEGRAHHGSDGP